MQDENNNSPKGFDDKIFKIIIVFVVCTIVFFGIKAMYDDYQRRLELAAIQEALDEYQDLIDSIYP